MHSLNGNMVILVNYFQKNRANIELMSPEVLHDSLMNISSDSSDLDAEARESGDEYDSDNVDEITRTFLQYC